MGIAGGALEEGRGSPTISTPTRETRAPFRGLRIGAGATVEGGGGRHVEALTIGSDWGVFAEAKGRVAKAGLTSTSPSQGRVGMNEASPEGGGGGGVGPDRPEPRRNPLANEISTPPAPLRERPPPSREG